MFPTSTLHACAVRSGKIWKSWRPTRTSWVDFTVLSSNFVCFSVFLINKLNFLGCCAIKVNGSKEQPSRFLQVQLISVWLIRYNHCKLIKLTFFVPFTKNGIFKLTKCGLSPKGFCILRKFLKNVKFPPHALPGCLPPYFRDAQSHFGLKGNN